MLRTTVTVQLPRDGDTDLRAFHEAVAYPELQRAIVRMAVEPRERVCVVHLTTSALDPTALSLRAAELVRSLLDRFYIHRQRLDSLAHTA